jgi:DNA-binding transcriptional regulator YiaG
MGSININWEELKSTHSKGDDTWMRVLNALHWDLAVPRHRLTVKVEDGWVTMSGSVDRPYERSCAESDARNVPGVVGVINNIRVGSSEAADAAADIAPDVDVRAGRRSTATTQAVFAATYRFGARTVRKWERAARRPRVPARTLLRAIKGLKRALTTA